jgi:hypothetical protein
MAEAIAEIKRAAPACKTLVGGLALDAGTNVLREIGADAHCARLEEAVPLGEALLGIAKG